MSLYAMEVEALQQVLAADGRSLDEVAAKAEPPEVAGVGVIPAVGMLEQRQSLDGLVLGSTLYPDIIRGVALLNARPDLAYGLLYVHSPGGTITGVTEAYEAIRNSEKPIYAYVHQADSAAYWLASACVDITASPSATIGSIGVYAVHKRPDGDKRVVVSPQSPDKVPDLDDDEQFAALQAQIGAQAQIFIDDVARGRGVAPEIVEQSFGRGASLCASEALARGMIDAVSRQIPQAPASRQGVNGMADARAEAPADEEPAVSMEEKYSAMEERVKAMEEELQAAKSRNAELTKELEEARAAEDEPETKPEEDEDPKVAALKAQVEKAQSQIRAMAEERTLERAGAWADAQVARRAVGADDITRAALVEAFVLDADGVASASKAHFEALPDGALGNTGVRTIGGGSERNGNSGYAAFRAKAKAKAEKEGRNFREVLAEMRAANPAAYHAAIKEDAR